MVDNLATLCEAICLPEMRDCRSSSADSVVERVAGWPRRGLSVVASATDLGRGTGPTRSCFALGGSLGYGIEHHTSVTSVALGS